MRTEQIPELFGVTGVKAVSAIGTGHINRTFLVESGTGRYILQSLNRSVFASPETVMANIAQVEQAFSGSSGVGVPHFLTCSGRNYVSADGEIWRMYAYSEGSASDRGLYRVGLSYGTFIRIMSTSGVEIKPVIVGFHDLDGYVSRLSQVCPEGEIPPLLITVAERLRSCFEGVPERIIHGDAKADNIMIGESCTVLDLDTVMRSYAALDYGDMLRSVCPHGADAVSVRELTHGFREGLGELLTERERETLYFGVLWTVCELAVRYLTDFYSPVRYFGGRTREQCLVRSRELLAQLEGFLAAEEELNGIIRSS